MSDEKRCAREQCLNPAPADGLYCGPGCAKLANPVQCALPGCSNPVAYPGAFYCGAACSHLAERGAPAVSEPPAQIDLVLQWRKKAASWDKACQIWDRIGADDDMGKQVQFAIGFSLLRDEAKR